MAVKWLSDRSRIKDDLFFTAVPHNWMVNMRINCKVKVIFHKQFIKVFRWQCRIQLLPKIDFRKIMRDCDPYIINLLYDSHRPALHGCQNLRINFCSHIHCKPFHINFAWLFKCDFPSGAPNHQIIPISADIYIRINFLH